MDRSDSQLMAMCATGDDEAFEALYDRHAKLVFHVAMTVTKSRQAAEEVTQDAFLALWRAAARFDPARASVRTWLVAVTRNVATDRLRRAGAEARANRGWIGREPPPPDDPVSEDVVGRAAAGELHDALRTLPACQCDVITRAFLEEQSHAQIGEALGLPIGTVKGRARLGLQRLRGALTAETATAV